LAEARTVAEELSLPYWWLNEQATSYLPAGQDAGAILVLERPGLTVLAASPRHLLALKVRAARQSDVADIVVLARLVGATSAEDAEGVATAVFGGEQLSERFRAVLADLNDAMHGSRLAFGRTPTRRSVSNPC